MTKREGKPNFQQIRAQAEKHRELRLAIQRASICMEKPANQELIRSVLNNDSTETNSRD
jgi:hypothetical protein